MSYRVLVPILFLGAGCSALINPDEDRLGVDPDGGVVTADASATPGVDGGSAPGVDAGSPPVMQDAGTVACAPAPPTCEGDAVVSCVDGERRRRDCQAEGAYCDEGACSSWECMPGARVCTPGLDGVLVCDARGADQMTISCAGGSCDPATGACVGVEPGACGRLPAVRVGGSEVIDLCGSEDHATYISGGDCDARSSADAGDRTFALRIDHPGTYRIELEDDDPMQDIDTVVYLRRRCDEPDSQVACGDDTACEPGFPPILGDCRMGQRLGLSRIEVELEPGTYYVVVDAFLYETTSFRAACGDVALRVDEAG